MKGNSHPLRLIGNTNISFRAIQFIFIEPPSGLCLWVKNLKESAYRFPPTRGAAFCETFTAFCWDLALPLVVGAFSAFLAALAVRLASLAILEGGGRREFNIELLLVPF